MRVPLSGLSPRYLAHQYRVVNNTNSDAINIHLNLQSTLAPTISPVYLQVWNVNSSAWETVASNSTAAEDIDFDLEYFLETNVSNYYDSRYEIAVRTYQVNNEAFTP